MEVCADGLQPGPLGWNPRAVTFTEHSVDTIQLPGWIIGTDNPVPAITHLAPSARAAGGPNLLLYVTGSGFRPTSEVRLGGAARATVYHSPSQLVATVLAGDMAVPAALEVRVFNPAPAGGLSGPATLTIS